MISSLAKLFTYVWYPFYTDYFHAGIPGIDSEVTFPALLLGEDDLVRCLVGERERLGFGFVKVEKSRFSNNLSSLCLTTK